MLCPFGLRVRACVDRGSDRDVWITNSRHHPRCQFSPRGLSHVLVAIHSNTTANAHEGRVARGLKLASRDVRAASFIGGPADWIGQKIDANDPICDIGPHLMLQQRTGASAPTKARV